MIVTIVGLVALLIARSLFKKEKPVVHSASSMGVAGDLAIEQIEEVLSKVLEKTKVWDEKAQAKASFPVGVQSMDLEASKKELAELKQILKTKESELKLLKSDASKASDGAASSGAASSEDTQKYLTRIEELESRLAEYEILEDDIADLSLYKEENSRLKGELERLRGSATSASQSAAVSGGEAPEPKTPEDLVKEFAEAVGKDSKESAFEPAAVAEPTAVAESIVESAVSAGASSVADAETEVDDLFAELASKNLDTDRVVSELQELQNLDSSTSAEDVLGGELDADKILAESDEMKS